jgi:hypothetical protein
MLLEATVGVDLVTIVTKILNVCVYLRFIIAISAFILTLAVPRNTCVRSVAAYVRGMVTARLEVLQLGRLRCQQTNQLHHVP